MFVVKHAQILYDSILVRLPEITLSIGVYRTKDLFSIRVAMPI